MKVEITSNKPVNTKRGPSVICQLLIRTAKGIVVHEQWMEPDKALPVGQYECDIELYQLDKRAAVGFVNFRAVSVKAA